MSPIADHGVWRLAQKERPPAIALKETDEHMSLRKANQHNQQELRSGKYHRYGRRGVVSRVYSRRTEFSETATRFRPALSGKRGFPVEKINIFCLIIDTAVASPFNALRRRRKANVAKTTDRE